MLDGHWMGETNGALLHKKLTYATSPCAAFALDAAFDLDCQGLLHQKCLDVYIGTLKALFWKYC